MPVKLSSVAEVPVDERISILVVDDRRLARIAARAILEDPEDLVCIGEATSGLEALSAARRLRPVVVLLDVEMPGLDGAETARRLLIQDPKLKLLAWTVSEESIDLLRMLGAGCSGYVLKDCSPTELHTAIRVVVRDETAVPRKMLSQVLREAARYVPRANSVKAILTPTEMQVLRFMAKGQPTKQIAIAIGTARSSVESHVKNLYRKLDVNSRAAAIGVALKQGLLRITDL